MIKDKKYIRKKWKQTGLKYYKTLYNKHNNEIKKLIKQEKQKNWNRKCNDMELQDNQDNTWKQLKYTMGTNKTQPKYPILITINEEKTKKRSETTEDKIEILTKTLK